MHHGWISLNLELLLLLLYHVKFHSSPWFLAAYVCCCHSSEKSFFYYTNRMNLLHLMRSSDRLLIVAKGFLKLPNLLTLIVFWIKVNLVYFPYVMALKSCFLHLMKQNWLLKSFLGTLNLMTQVLFHLLCFLELIWKWRSFKLVKKLISHPDSSKASGPDFIPMMVSKNCGSELSCLLKDNVRALLS